MDVKNKRGQTTNIVGKVLGFLFVIFFMMVFIFTIMNLSNGTVMVNANLLRTTVHLHIPPCFNRLELDISNSHILYQ